MEMQAADNKACLFVCLFGIYGISTFAGYLMPNQSLYEQFYFKQFNLAFSTQFNCQKHFFFKLLSFVKQF